MFYNRVSLQFSELNKRGLFTDLTVSVSSGDENKRFKVHKIIMCAASAYFFDRLAKSDKGKKAIDSISLDMKPSSFEAYLSLVYDGYTIIETEDLADFQSALQMLEPLCMPDPDDPAPSTSKKSRKKPKMEDGVDVKPDFKTVMELDIDDLPEEKVSRLIIVGEGQKDFMCCICNKKFQKKGSTFDHIMTDHRTKRDYPCNYCGQGFPTSNRRSIHISKLHSALHKVRKALEE